MCWLKFRFNGYNYYFFPELVLIKKLVSSFPFLKGKEFELILHEGIVAEIVVGKKVGVGKEKLVSIDFFKVPETKIVFLKKDLNKLLNIKKDFALVSFDKDNSFAKKFNKYKKIFEKQKYLKFTPSTRVSPNFTKIKKEFQLNKFNFKKIIWFDSIQNLERKGLLISKRFIENKLIKLFPKLKQKKLLLIDKEKTINIFYWDETIKKISNNSFLITSNQNRKNLNKIIIPKKKFQELFHLPEKNFHLTKYHKTKKLLTYSYFNEELFTNKIYYLIYEKK